MAEVPEVICGAKASHCVCVLAPEHDDDTHTCVPECGGEWRGEWDGDDFEPVTFPGDSGRWPLSEDDGRP